MFLVRSVPAFTLLFLLLRVGVSPLHLRPSFNFTPWFPRNNRMSPVGRSRILSELRRQPGRQLVLVRYSPGLYDLALHKTGDWPPWGVWEWVYNGADIEDQKVVWAHDMGPAQNEELVQYFSGRHVWLLYADDQPPKLVPYSEATDGNTPAAAFSGKPDLSR
ncbi:MAG: hypothetical protein P8Z30_20485 [Acidobacteriota bacterium]